VLAAAITTTTTLGVTVTDSTTQGIKTVLHPVSDPEAANDPDGNLLGLLQDQ
jgi:hypothetical protein